MASAACDMQVKVLLVDDEENILRALKRLLMDENLEVITAVSGREALEIIKSHRDIGVIVSDQRMPEISGVEVLERARQIVPNAARILLTGYTDVSAAIEAINRGGAYRFISKPWEEENLLQIVKDAAFRYSLIQENKKLTETVQKQNDELKQWNIRLEHHVQDQTAAIKTKNRQLEELNTQLHNTFKSTITAFSRLIELRDTRVSDHSKNVAEVAAKAAKALGLPAQEVDDITVASLLHDIGKLGMPSLLLLKDVQEMRSNELDLYMTHPIRGQTAVDAVDALRKPGVLIRHHHERFDGTGFSDRLKGEQIPLGSRIIAMADFVDRALKKLSSDNAIDLALNELQKQLKARFDPQLFPCMQKAVRITYQKMIHRSGIVEYELLPSDLQVGMIVSRDVRSGTGVLLLSKGIKLNEHNIAVLNRLSRLDPSRNGVFVWVEE